ncbi:MFS transporter [Novosphingobium resinovorum]|uniref:MFS transporter n=1 Tax=Novosphingobium resinovorum TaxID=158500 RepID=A0A031JDA0_9SPHN|nr:MFS transporter [Novosphingobium resinovorum]AOR79679.1 MFS transporter [Novosphingobium resinovorum]EZP71242.1 Major facilitator transporter [Novosphingobium resinovorum]
MALALPEYEADSADGPATWTSGGLFTVAFLGVTAGVQMSDRGLQSILLSAIQDSFRVGDATIGALQGLAGVLVGSAVAVPLARLADRLSRKKVLLGLIAGWTCLMALSALAPDFPLFFVGRAASGVTEFAMIPIVYSMIPDIAPDRHRVTANLCFAALMAAGASAGFYFGDVIVQMARQTIPLAMEPWRKALLLLSFAGAPLFALGLLTHDPARQIAPSDPGGRSAALGPFLRERWQAVGLFVGVAGSLMIAVQALNPLIALALERRFDADLGKVGHAMGVVTLVTSIGCLPVAGVLDRTLRSRFGLAARPLIMGAGALCAVPCSALLIVIDSVGAALWVVAFFLFVTCTANALVPTMLQDLTPATLRARSFAIWSFVVSVFCAIGPLAAGALSDLLLGGRLLTAIAVTAIPALLLSTACAARSIATARRFLKSQPT